MIGLCSQMADDLRDEKGRDLHAQSHSQNKNPMWYIHKGWMEYGGTRLAINMQSIEHHY
jgi:hypothetical protein